MPIHCFNSSARRVKYNTHLRALHLIYISTSNCNIHTSDVTLRIHIIIVVSVDCYSYYFKTNMRHARVACAHIIWYVFVNSSCYEYKYSVVRVTHAVLNSYNDKRKTDKCYWTHVQTYENHWNVGGTNFPENIFYARCIYSALISLRHVYGDSGLKARI